MATTSLRLHRRRTGERVIKGALLACGVVSVATTVGIILSLAFETVEFFRAVPILDFLTGTRWAPTFSPSSFGVLPLVAATLVIAGIAVAVATPLGLGAAIYLSEYARPKTRKIIKPTLEVLAGIPTVVFGYFGLLFVTPELIQPLVPGTQVFNALAAGIVVGIAIIPVVASISEDAMRAVPRSLREAAYGMGATKRTVATKVVVPAALSGIAAAVILALSRAVGETMIVTIMAGGQPNLTADVRQGMQTMTAYIVQASLGDTPQTSIAYKTIFALGSTLFVMTLTLNIISTSIVRRFRERYE
ncbi:MAG: phosphate ABC transporter permease subunit PstC [Acidobacteria bacterium]|nr:phosphate ABC transporter permease subunit PstC [Acidobacteriota bacterium]